MILGGGLTGISAALHLELPYLLIEREGRLGGLARTEQRDGHYFDHTGHWLHLRSDDMRNWVLRLLGEQMVEVERRARIYSSGVTTLYPFQANLHGLPAEVVSECLIGFVKTLLDRGRQEPRNFEEYILHHFGDGIAKHFMVPYNHKLWGVHPREITSAWCQRFVPRPNMEQVVAGAVGAGPAQLGYNVKFLYPKQGGIETMAKALAAEVDAESTRLNTTVDGIEAGTRKVLLGGESLAYHAVISSIPLPRLIELIVDAPDAVRQAAGKLRATPVRYLNVGTRRPSPLDHHWVYVPEQRLPFYRVGVFSNAVASLAPAGRSSLYVELSSRTAPEEQVVRESVQGLVEMGVVGSAEDIAFADMRVIDPAYVVFDDAYEAALQVIHPYLEQERIYSRGRYGAWIYNSMEDSLLAGKETAELVNRLAPE